MNKNITLALTIFLTIFSSIYCKVNEDEKIYIGLSGKFSNIKTGGKLHGTDDDYSLSNPNGGLFPYSVNSNQSLSIPQIGTLFGYKAKSIYKVSPFVEGGIFLLGKSSNTIILKSKTTGAQGDVNNESFSLKSSFGVHINTGIYYNTNTEISPFAGIKVGVTEYEIKCLTSDVTTSLPNKKGFILSVEPNVGLSIDIKDNVAVQFSTSFVIGIKKDILSNYVDQNQIASTSGKVSTSYSLQPSGYNLQAAVIWKI